MFIARVQGEPGRVVVAYDSVSEAREAKSCLTCTKYRDFDICRFYATCRAGKAPEDEPYMYNPAGSAIVQTRLGELPKLYNKRKV